MLELVRLLTHNGMFVTEVEIPMFNPPVEILRWGDRIFVLGFDCQYYEGLLWTVQ